MKGREIMKKNINLLSLVIAIFAIIFVSSFTGCGDDGTVISNFQGPTGPAGIEGPTGPEGPQGVTGPSDWASLTLQVALTDGNPLSNYVATLIRQSTTPETTENTTVSAVPDPNGVYVFEYVAPGDYKLIVESQGYCPQSRELTLIPGENTNFTGDDRVTMVRGLYGATGFSSFFISGFSEMNGSQINGNSSIYLINCNTGESLLINTVDYTIIAMDFLPGSSPEELYAIAVRPSLQPASFEEDITASGPPPFFFDHDSLVILQMDSGGNVLNTVDLRLPGPLPLDPNDSISDVSFNSSGQFYAFLEDNWFNTSDPGSPDLFVPVNISTGIMDPGAGVSAPGEDSHYNSIAFTPSNFFYINGTDNFPDISSTLYTSPVNLSPFGTVNDAIEYLFLGMDYREADSTMFASALQVTNNPFSNEILVSINLQTGEISPKGAFRDVTTQSPIPIYTIAAPLTQQLP